MSVSRPVFTARPKPHSKQFNLQEADPQAKSMTTNFFEANEVTPCSAFFDFGSESPHNAYSRQQFASRLFDYFRQAAPQKSTKVTAMCSVVDVVVVALSNCQLLMFDTTKNQVTYTQANFTKTPITSLHILKGHRRTYMLVHTADFSLSVHSFPNPQLLE